MTTTKRIWVNMDHDDGTVDEGDRVVVHANGMVVDIIANEDGSVYVEAYAYESRAGNGNRQQAVVQHAAIDRYQHRHPNIRLELAESRT